MVQYPADPATDTPAVWVAHFAHPIEVEWVARVAPAPKDWPKLLLQVGAGMASPQAALSLCSNIASCSLTDAGWWSWYQGVQTAHTAQASPLHA